MSNSLCMVNAALVSEPTKLSQGCVVVLGKTNMFRYNDPKEAEHMRKNKTNGTNSANRSLLSQSLSDLRQASGMARTKERLNPKLHSSEGDMIRESKETEEVGTAAAASSDSNFITAQDAINNNGNMNNDLTTSFDADASSSGLKDDEEVMSIVTSAGKPEDATEEMNELYKNICEQKNVIMKCLESEQCDISTLNKQISILQNMQDNYSKLEYEITRNMWMSTHSNNSTVLSDDEGLKSFDEQFSVLVEQEVERRIFQVSNV